LLEKYPDLRICLAHMGGSDEIPLTASVFTSEGVAS